MDARRQVASLVSAVVVLGGSWLLPGVVCAGEFPTVPYALLENSTYQEGCFDPCDCLLLEPQPMKGTFDMVFYPYEGPVWTVGIENVAWSVPDLGIEITGSGTYMRAGDMQQMVLELAVGENPVTTFDSGWVEGGGTYPAIDVVVTMNQMVCYDIVLEIHALPADASLPKLAVDRLALSWTELPDAPVFDVVCGDLTTLVETGSFTPATDECLANDLDGTELPYSMDVEAGRGVWFLLREQGGTYDSDLDSQPASRDPGIDASPLSCP